MRHTKENKIDINPLLQGQHKLDLILHKNANMRMVDTLLHQEIALFVEVGEMINEIGHIWKYWKKNHPVNMEKIKEELADVLHFVLSQGHMITVLPYHSTIIYYSDPVEHLNKFMRAAMQCNKSHAQWWTCFGLFRGLVDLMGISWDDMVAEYWEKHDKNIERQYNGY